jgi:hexosaminidase
MFLPLVFVAAVVAQASPSIAVIPRPVKVTERTGHFTLEPTTVIWADATSAPIARQFARYVEPATGYTLRVRIAGEAPIGSIAFKRDRTLSRLGPEGYVLDVRPGRIVARAPELAGLFYAVQTIRQLLPPDIFRAAPAGRTIWTMPAVAIEDYPRFEWRGAHLDVGRHFMPKEFVKKYIDLLSLHKLNVFHWHLTEDQGWRLEIKQYPRLTEVGAWRKETLIGRQRGQEEQKYDGKRHGGFYTQEDAREIVAYAKERFITVVPEIEMPGHAVAAIAAYPELGVTGEPMNVATHWGVFSDILNAKPSTMQFMQNVLTEVMAIFPGRYVHIGGDEADKTKWKASPEIQARIKELGLKDEHELQSWFIRQMDAFLTSHGRRLVGWDEILEGGLAENAVVMSWRGTEGGIAAARAGHDVVMAPTSNTYLDYAQSRDPNEPVGQTALLTIDKVYAFDPVPDELEPAFVKHILGGQAQVWTEYMADAKAVEYMTFPRLTALAEAVWTQKARKDYADFALRLTTHLDRLRALDVNFHPVVTTQ